MRYVTVVFRPVERIHPSIPPLIETPAVTPVAIHQTRLLDDGTQMTLFQVRGDTDVLGGVLSDHPAIREFAIAGTREPIVYSHSEPHDTATDLLELRDRHEVVFQMPLRFTGDGGLRGTILGDEATFQRAIDALPAEIDVELVRTGDYTPDVHDLFAQLTDRQQEILRTAIHEGYYESPREVSQSDIADCLDIAPGTVSRHLRRIEAKIFSTRMVSSPPSEDRQ